MMLGNQNYTLNPPENQADKLLLLITIYPTKNKWTLVQMTCLFKCKFELAILRSLPAFLLKLFCTSANMGIPTNWRRSMIFRYGCWTFARFFNMARSPTSSNKSQYQRIGRFNVCAPLSSQSKFFGTCSCRLVICY